MRVPSQCFRYAGADVAGDLDPFPMGPLGNQYHRVFEQLARIELGRIEFQFAGLDLGQIQNIVDDVEKILADFCTACAN